MRCERSTVAVAAALFAGVLLPLTLPGAAAAQSTYPLVSDHDGAISAVVQDGDTVQVRGINGRSYACQITATAAPSNSSTLSFSTITDPNGAELAGTNKINCGGIAPIILVGAANTHRNAARFCFSATAGGTYTLTIAAAPGGEAARFFCEEVSLYGGFNTNSSDLNYLEIKNLTQNTITGTVTAIDRDSQVKIDAQPFSVNSYSRTDVDIHTAVGKQVYGLLIVDYLGPQGALRANLSEYKITTAVPLTFTKVADVPLSPRKSTDQ